MEKIAQGYWRLGVAAWHAAEAFERENPFSGHLLPTTMRVRQRSIVSSFKPSINAKDCSDPPQRLTVESKKGPADSRETCNITKRSQRVLWCQRQRRNRPDDAIGVGTFFAASTQFRPRLRGDNQ